MIPINDTQNERWDLFENAATYNYARSVLEKYKKKDTLTIDDDKPRRAMNTTEFVAFFYNYFLDLMLIFLVQVLQNQLLTNSKQEEI
jgi:hypothetical protein